MWLYRIGVETQDLLSLVQIILFLGETHAAVDQDIGAVASISVDQLLDYPQLNVFQKFQITNGLELITGMVMERLIR